MKNIRYIIAAALVGALIIGCSGKHSEQAPPSKPATAIYESNDAASAEEDEQKKKKSERQAMPDQEINQANPSEDDMERLD
ncbi:hypothetical protein SIN8267_01942 [Sinobacterium norvegicum]|uniref:Lipoprotein n=1 Tax=Sinobacterium norvegicum TaxID=1641715 RepID=A0ABN8EKB7_9GAMM|nr:hypothetical protein [Sinobacterium norvegicum]CAH0991827.1 hypothetical protein SIN8267_01942 [Sinobacterium norvegicum]